MIIIMLIFATVSVLLPFLIARSVGVVSYVSPLHLVSYFSFFGVFVKTVAYCISPDNLFFINFVQGKSEVLFGYVYYTLFIIFLCAGYVFSASLKMRACRYELNYLSIESFNRPVLLFASASFIYFLFLSLFTAAKGLSGVFEAFSVSGMHSLNSSKISRIEGVEGFGRSFAMIQTLMIIPTFAFLFFLSKTIVYKRKSDIVKSVVLLVMCAFAAIVTGNRMDLAALLVYFLCIWGMLGKKINFRIVIKMLLGFLAVIAIFVFMTTLRSTKESSDGFVFGLSEILNPIVKSTYFLDINMSVLIVNLTEVNEMLFGESYLWWTFGWVPRDFWPDKPAITLGPYVKQEILGMYGTIGGINPTGPGEAFINFGWFGLIVAMILGVIYRSIEVFLNSPKMLLNGGSLWLYPLIFYPFVQATLQSSFSAVVVGLAASSFSVLILLRVFKRKIVL